MTTKKDLFTGARARLLIDGVPLAFATNVDGEEEIMYQPLDVLDSVEVAEHVPVGYMTSLSLGSIWIVKQTFKSLGLFPKVGANAEEHLRNILNQKDLTVLIEDSQATPVAPIAIFTGVKFGRIGWSIQPRAIVSRNVTAVAIRQLDASEV